MTSVDTNLIVRLLPPDKLKTFDKAFVEKSKGCSDCQVCLP